MKQDIGLFVKSYYGKVGIEAGLSKLLSVLFNGMSSLILVPVFLPWITRPRLWAERNGCQLVVESVLLQSAVCISTIVLLSFVRICADIKSVKQHWVIITVSEIDICQSCSKYNDKNHSQHGKETKRNGWPSHTDEAFPNHEAENPAQAPVDALEHTWKKKKKRDC